MGILNVTPDSFSDGGKWCGLATAVEHGMRLVEEGADIVDVGGESSRPGAKEISQEEELRRVLPVVKELAARGAKVSVDTRRAEVARQALDAGARVINDITAGADPDMFKVVRDTAAGMVLMRGWNAKPPVGMERVCLSLTRRIKAAFRQNQPPLSWQPEIARNAFLYLSQRMKAALAAGIARKALLIDPGVGFSNDADEDVGLLFWSPQLSDIAPMVIGVSRKRFLGALSGETDPAKRMPASLAAALFTVAFNGSAKILRVHDVAETVQALKVFKALSTYKIPKKQK